MILIDNNYEINLKIKSIYAFKIYFDLLKRLLFILIYE